MPFSGMASGKRMEPTLRERRAVRKKGNMTKTIRKNPRWCRPRAVRPDRRTAHGSTLRARIKLLQAHLAVGKEGKARPGRRLHRPGWRLLLARAVPVQALLLEKMVQLAQEVLRAWTVLLAQMVLLSQAVLLAR
jgi:hypothetical protein